MSASVEQLEKEALELPADQRAQLVDRLWESLGDTTVPVLTADWEAEIERRRREISSGAVKSVDGESVSRKAWARVKLDRS